MGNPGLSYARVERLILRLPAESRLWKSILKEENLDTWSRQDELLASIFDALNLQLWVSENQHKKRGQQSKQPDRYPRPSDKAKEEQEKMAKADLARRLLEQRERLFNASKVQD